jgi:hypothetical protein
MRHGWISALSLSALLGGWALPGREPPTWEKDVAPIIQARCSQCHTKGGHGPFALETYRDVKRRAALVREELLKRTMPPCISTSDFGEFCTSTPLTDEQLVMFQEWFRADEPMGASDPTPPNQNLGFRLGAPDMTLTPIVEPDVPTEGNGLWRAVLIDPKNTKPLHIRAFDVVPRSPLIIQHVLLAVAAPGLKESAWPTNGTLDAKASRLIGSWAPGYRAWRLPDGVSMTIQPGEKLIAQILVVPAGRPLSAQIDVGLYLSHTSNDREPRWIDLEKRDFDVPAYQEVTMTTSAVLDRDVEVLSVVPEARFYCYLMNVYRVNGDDRRLLFRSNKWTPYWTGAFVFEKPVPMKAGMKIESNFTFENEEHTAINEGRVPRDVHSGPEINEEVCRTHILVIDSAGR